MSKRRWNTKDSIDDYLKRLLEEKIEYRPKIYKVGDDLIIVYGKDVNRGTTIIRRVKKEDSGIIFGQQFDEIPEYIYISVDYDDIPKKYAKMIVGKNRFLPKETKEELEQRRQTLITKLVTNFTEEQIDTESEFIIKQIKEEIRLIDMYLSPDLDRPLTSYELDKYDTPSETELSEEVHFDEDDMKDFMSYREDGGKMHKHWRGCENIDMLYFNNWSDPSLLWNGYEFNYWDVEDVLWDDFIEYATDVFGVSREEIDSEDFLQEEFDKYCQDFAEGYLGDLVAFDYFEDGSKSWRR